MSALYLIAVTDAQLKALKWAAAHSQSVYEASIPETERNIAFFAERGEEDHEKLARNNLANARRHLADIQSASPALYLAKPFPSPASSSHAADHEATDTVAPSDGRRGTTPPADVCPAGGALDCNHGLLRQALTSVEDY